MIEYYIHELLSMGVTYIPPWSELNPEKAKELDDVASPEHLPTSKENGATAAEDVLTVTTTRARSDSSSSKSSLQSSLQLGATAATIKEPTGK